MHQTDPLDFTGSRDFLEASWLEEAAFVRQIASEQRDRDARISNKG